MAHAEVQGHIHRPAQDVFEYIANVHHLPEWSSMVLDVQDVQLATPEREGHYTVSAKVLGRRLDTSYRLRHDGASACTAESVGGPIVHTWHYTFTPHGDSTDVRVTLDGDPRTYFKLAAPLAVSMLQRQMQLDLETLKVFLEARPRPP